MRVTEVTTSKITDHRCCAGPSCGSRWIRYSFYTRPAGFFCLSVAERAEVSCNSERCRMIRASDRAGESRNLLLPRAILTHAKLSTELRPAHRSHHSLRQGHSQSRRVL